MHDIHRSKGLALRAIHMITFKKVQRIELLPRVWPTAVLSWVRTTRFWHTRGFYMPAVCVPCAQHARGGVAQ